MSSFTLPRISLPGQRTQLKSQRRLLSPRVSCCLAARPPCQYKFRGSAVRAMSVQNVQQQEDDQTDKGSGSKPSLDVDVAIIGGGPAGLATAFGVQRALGPKFRVAVFERTPGLLKIGGQVALQAPALNALDALDGGSGTLSAAVAEAGDLRHLLRTLDKAGNVEAERPIPPEANQVVIPWFKLQRTLAAALPEGTIYHDCELEALDVSDETTTVLTFTNGQECRAKIVIGADGNLSKVRPAIFGPGEAKPEYADSVIWRMFMDADFPGIETGELNVWTGDGKVLVLQKMETYGVHGNDKCTVYASCQSYWPEDQLDVLDRKRYIGEEDGGENGGTTRNHERLERFLNEFEGFPEQVLDFVAENAVTASILEHPIFFRPPGRPWGKGNVTLIGDAAHIIPPNMGMGTPLALEDAVALANSLAEFGLSEQALREYETERRKRVDVIAEAAIRGTTDYYKKKDDDANPFKQNDQEMFKFVMNYKQDPVPAANDVVTKGSART